MKTHSRCRKSVKRFKPSLLLLVVVSVLLGGCQTIKQIYYTYDPLNFHAVDEERLVPVGPADRR